MCLVCYVNAYYHYQLNRNAENTCLPVHMSACSLYCNEAKTVDRCNRKSSSFTNTRTIITKDNLTPKPQWIRKQPLLLVVQRLLNHNLLPVHVVMKIFVRGTIIPRFWTTTSTSSTDVDFSIHQNPDATKWRRRRKVIRCFGRQNAKLSWRSHKKEY